MQALDSQNTVALAVVATAAAYLISRAVSVIWRRKRGCAVGCASCPVQEPDRSTTDASMVSLEELSASGKRLGNEKGFHV
jgi:hypothetical protein